jgi:hypothetical protein
MPCQYLSCRATDIAEYMDAEFAAIMLLFSRKSGLPTDKKRAPFFFGAMIAD